MRRMAHLTAVLETTVGNYGPPCTVSGYWERWEFSVECGGWLRNVRTTEQWFFHLLTSAASHCWPGNGCGSIQIVVQPTCLTSIQVSWSAYILIGKTFISARGVRSSRWDRKELFLLDRWTDCS